MPWPEERPLRRYEDLAHVEQAFRCMKQIDIHVRPIRHRTEDHVRALIFLCVLAYSVDWHMRQSLSPLLYEDEDLEQDRRNRDPVAKAHPSASAARKKIERKTPDGFPLHDFQSLLSELATQTKGTYQMKIEQPGVPSTFTQITEPTPIQAYAFQLLGLYP